VNPAQGTTSAEPLEARLEGGTKLSGRAWLCDSPRAIVAILHGIGEHSGRYAALAADLVRARCTVVALDLPGHGQSPGPRGDMPSWVAVRDQAVSAMFAAPGGLPGQPERAPRVLLGHSMGGLMALDYTLAHPRGLVTTIASGPALASAMPPWWKLALANVARMTAPTAGFPTGLDASGEGGVSRDAEVMRLRDADRLVHDRISPRLYFDFEEARQRVVRDARRLQVPTLLLHGEADRMVDPDGTRAFVAAAPKGMTKLVTFPGAYHEVFNDLGRDDVVREVVTWLDVMLAR
jgi:alpha-beta hydrolase superfamily lysophospholipase